MSLSFYSNSREDSIATFVIALILTSRFFDLNPDATLIPFAIATGAVALALSKIFYTISRLVFGYFDHRNVYTGTKSYVNAYSSSYFNQYRQSLMNQMKIDSGKKAI